MPRPITDDGVAVWQPLQPGDKEERVARDVVLAHLPDNRVLRIDLDEAMIIAAGDQRVAVGQANPDEAAAWIRVEKLAGRVELHRLSVELARDVRALGRLADLAKLRVRSAAERDFHRVRDRRRAIHFVEEARSIGM